MVHFFRTTLNRKSQDANIARHAADIVDGYCSGSVGVAHLL